jgi:uncharacterized protein YbaR (Trm112 family)
MLLQHIFALALQQVSPECVHNLISLLRNHTTPEGKLLRRSLQDSNEQAWKCVEIALFGEGWWDRLAEASDSPEDRDVATQLRDSLGALPCPEGIPREACLKELRTGQANRVLTSRTWSPPDLASELEALREADEPDEQDFLLAQRKRLGRLSREVKDVGYPTLAQWLARQPPGRPHLFVLAMWYFFRRAVEEYSTPMQGRTVREPDPLDPSYAKAFDGLHEVLENEKPRLQRLLHESPPEAPPAPPREARVQQPPPAAKPNGWADLIPPRAPAPPALRCPHCDRQLGLNASHAGMTLRCQACSNLFRFTGTATLPCPAPPPAPTTGASGGQASLLHINCPHCKRTLAVPGTARGQVLNCPLCKGGFRLG